jgi:hypothetical protein
LALAAASLAQDVAPPPGGPAVDPVPPVDADGATAAAAKPPPPKPAAPGAGAEAKKPPPKPPAAAAAAPADEAPKKPAPKPAAAPAPAPADTAPAVDAALKRQGAKKGGLPVAQLPAVVAALAPRTVHQKPLTADETERVAAAFNVSGDTLSRDALKAIADDPTSLFMALADANGDGAVSKDEYVAYVRRDARGSTANATSAPVPPSVDRLFDAVAGPGAASIDAAAAKAANLADGAAAFFAAADANGDGVVDEEELSAPLPASTADADGKLVWVPMAKHMDAGTVLRVYGR